MSLPKWLVLALMLLAAFAAVTVWVNDALSAENAPHNLRTSATEAGLPTDFELVEGDGDFEAYFTTGGSMCMIFMCIEVPPHISVTAPADWPYGWKLAALYHEIGHYEQYRENVPREEWDADLRSAKRLCALGMNGPELVAGMLAHITPRVKIESPRHGNHYRRIEHLRGYGCRDRGLRLLDVNQS
jgi:hypothetical protein